MMHRRIALFVLLFCMASGALAAQPAMIVLDASGSMWGRTGERSRIDTARDAVAALMSRWPAGRPVGLAAFGHRRTQDCADAEVLHAPATDPDAIASLVQDITPRGRTSAAEAARLAAEALGADAGSVILVTDGVETCHPDPCAVAQAIARSGARVAIHTIGFAVSDPVAIAQLRCMAEATGGRAQTAADASELAEALDRAAASPTPGPRASAPRAEPVPVPRLVVTVRLCAGCDPMTGDARIQLLRGHDIIATNGDPFGRFFDLPAGDYAVAVETPLFERGPVAATVPASGPGRVEVILDAGWLVGDVRTDPSGLAVTRLARIALHPLSAPDEGQRPPAEAETGHPAFLVPTGVHRLTASIGNATGSAEAAVTAGEVVVLPVPLRFGTLVLRREGFGVPDPRISITALDGDHDAVDDWPAEDRAEFRLAPGLYRVAAIHGGLYGEVDIRIGSEATQDVTLRPAP